MADYEIVHAYSPVLVGRVIGRVVGLTEPTGEVGVAGYGTRVGFARRLIDFGLVVETTEDALSARIGRDDETPLTSRVVDVAGSHRYAVVVFSLEEESEPVPIAKDIVTDQLIAQLDGSWQPLSPDVPERPAWLPREDT
jgi:hypothetical protein